MNAKNNPNMNKISQIIQMSQNYAAHKKMVRQAKSCIDQSSLQKNRYHQKLLHQHSRYVEAIQKIKNKKLDESNKKLTQKLIEASKPVSKQQVIQQNTQSITSRSFWNLKTAKQRKRSQQKRQIHSLNQKMSQRLSKSRSKEDFGLNSYKKQRTQTRTDRYISSQFSKRSQSVLENLVYNNLNLKAEDIPFLPQLSKRYHVQFGKKNRIENKSSPRQKQTVQSFLSRISKVQKQINFFQGN